jgi:hypothetical protein
MQDQIKATGELQIVLKDENGNVKDERLVKNLVVNVGKNFLVSRALGTSSAVMSAMAVGTNSTVAATSDTTLGTETARVSGANFVAAVGSSSNILSYTGTFGPGVGTGSLTEAGIFNSTTTGGVLLARTVFSVINKAAGDSLAIAWNITLN